MFRKLFERSTVIQRQMLFSYFAGQRYQSKLFRFTQLLAPVHRHQRQQLLTFSTLNCGKDVDEAEINVDLNPILIELREKLQCSKSEAIEVYEHLSTSSGTVNMKQIIKTIKWLKRKGATSHVIVKNCHILLIPNFPDALEASYERLSRSKWEHIDDFLPLLAIDESKIRSIQMQINHVIKARIYLLKKYFSIEPHIISHYCSKHLFVFEIELELLKKKLDMLLDCNVSPDNILRDLNVLARAEDRIKGRLEFLKTCGIERIMPWMIKCPDHVLHRSIEIRKSWGTETNKTVELLTDRLHWHGQTAIRILRQYSFLSQMSTVTVSELLDELLKVFSPEEITKNMSLLQHPVSHVKERVAELTSLKVYPVQPEVMNMSDIRFKEHFSKKTN